MTSGTRCSSSSTGSDGAPADPEAAGAERRDLPAGPRAAPLSRLGLGTLQFPVVGQQLADRLVARALAGGVTTFDTALRYGPAEMMLGRALAASPSGRQASVVAKTHRRTAAAVIADVEAGRLNLGRERIEVYMIHDVRWGTDMDQAFGPGGAFEALTGLREKGLIGAAGLSTHRPDVALEAVDREGVDALMIPANVIDRGAFAPAIGAAVRRGVLLLGMKALGGGTLLPATRALIGALTSEFDRVFIGVRSEEELVEDMAAARTAATAQISAAPSPPVDVAGSPAPDLDKAIRELAGGFCHGCGYCLPCPEGVPIPEIMRLWRLVTIYHSGDLGGFSYRRLPVKAQACTGCGLCEERCSFGVPVRKHLRAAHFDLTVGVASGKGQ